MVIEFLFSEIKDKTKLYNEEPLQIKSPFTEEIETVPCGQYIGNRYCSESMEIVKNKMTEIKQYKYKGALERIANEVFELASDSTVYTVSCTIDTYPSARTRMLVSILAEYCNKFDNAENNTNASIETYDKVLEKLKLEVKDVFRKDWASCVWIKDEQSEYLCSDLYPYIFKAENRLRAFANKLLIWELGSEWLNSPGLEKYAESHKKLSEDFRSREPAFSDVDDVFISTTLEALFEIIQKGIVYEPLFQLSQKQFNDLTDLVTKADKRENISKWINKRRGIKKNLWKDIFEPYFTSAENAQQIITDFIKNRNHIAHNKPLTLSAHTTMEKNFTDFNDMVKNANKIFEESVPSEELYLTIDIQNEQAQEAEEQKEYERNYLRNRIEGETGVEILWRDDIFEMLFEKSDMLYQKIHDLYYWDNRFTISSINTIEDNETWQTLFSIQCNANKKYYLEIQIEIIIDDEMDGDSKLNLRYLIHGENSKITYSCEDGIEPASIRYHNGSGYENTLEGTIELNSDSSLDESEIEDFIRDLKTAIEEFNPYIATKDTLEMLAAKEGGCSPVADFPCYECEQYGISLQDDFYQFGHCCYCGTDNEIQICEICGTPFGYDGGHDGICDYCIEHIKNE